MSTGPLSLGKQRKIMDVSATAAGVSTECFIIDTDSVEVAVWVESTAGDLDIVVSTVGDEDNRKFPIVTFPTISVPTSQLLLRKSVLSLQRVEVRATYSDAVDFCIIVRAINGADAVVSISPPSTLRASQIDVDTSAKLVIPAALEDREGLLLKNNSNSGILYIGGTAGESAIGIGMPLGPGEPLGIDIAAGQEIWMTGSEVGIDLRILEAGS